VRVKYFGDAFRLEHAANLFSKLVEREPEVAALLAQSPVATWISGSDPSCQPAQILAGIRERSSERTLEKQCFGCFQKLEFTFQARDRIEFAVSSETIAGVVCISNSTEDGREVCLLPYRRRGFASGDSQRQLREFARSAYFSPLKSTT
jgi:hypothetical protein